MIAIDGSQGEGGGQILRTALTLSTITGRPFRMEGIRARRPEPGLKAQHRTAVLAAARISGARVQGDGVGSRTLEFEPGPVEGGDWVLDVGTAGSTSLVLQTVALPLALARRPSTVRVTGGTHVPSSPSHDWLEAVWVPAVRRAGFRVSIARRRAGFHPRGGGEAEVRVEPSPDRVPLELLARSPAPRALRIRSLVGGLPRSIALRQRDAARAVLGSLGPVEEQIEESPSFSPGTAVLVSADLEDGFGGGGALGARGKPAERVGEEAARAFLEFWGTGRAVDEHLADQLLIALALGGGPSRYTTARVTSHLRTNADVVRLFLPVPIGIAGTTGGPGLVTVGGAPSILAAS